MNTEPAAGSLSEAGSANSSKEGPITGLGAVILAAGLGKRMRSKVAKVLHPLCGRPMILYALELAERVAGRGVAVVVGHQGERVRALIENHAEKNECAQPVTVVDQPQQLGTGHAVMQARSAFMQDGREPAMAFLLLNGDTPLLTDTTVRKLWNFHQARRATITILTAVLDDPSGYGRIVRGALESDEGGRSGPKPSEGLAPSDAVLRIVEDRDASAMESELHEVNVGTYLVDAPFLIEALDKLEPKNAQKEYYLTDLVGMAVERGLRVAAISLQDPREGLGINSREQLAEAQGVIRQQIRKRWMNTGVTLHDPATTWIDAGVAIGQDTVLYPHVTLEGSTRIGEDCVIRSHVRLTDCALGDRVVVQDSCVLREARLEEESVVGPFAHLRPGAVLHRRAKVGNFVEMKEAQLGDGSKANHLTYLGDVRVGRNVNIGAGTVTCNYDGVRKNETVIEDNVFVGSDALLIAPVRVGRGSLVAAGSTVTQDVPDDALAIGRAVQVNRPGWAARRRALQQTGGSPAVGKQAGPRVNKKKGDKRAGLKNTPNKR